MPDKTAATDHPIHEFLARRWSPHSFQQRLVTAEDLQSLFEAARWAPSSYNEQPWSFIVATRDDRPEYERLLSCLVEGNQAWARTAPVLALGMVTHKFKRNNKENKAAVHDLGLAAANLVMEATARGLFVHQMIGIVPDRARELYQIPTDAEAWTALAIGYRDESTDRLAEELKEREAAPRQRKPLGQFVFTGKWGSSSAFARPG